MDTDTQIIQDFEAHKAAPILAARTRLAPKADEYRKIKETLLGLIDSDRPELEKAQRLYAYAARQGIRHHALEAALGQAFGHGLSPGFLETAPATCQQVVDRITRFSQKDLDDGQERFLAQKAPSLRALIGAHNRLVKSIKRGHAELQEMLRRAGASAEVH
jgi:hypothetical protein